MPQSQTSGGFATGLALQEGTRCSIGRLIRHRLLSRPPDACRTARQHRGDGHTEGPGSLRHHDPAVEGVRVVEPLL